MSALQILLSVGFYKLQVSSLVSELNKIFDVCSLHICMRAIILPCRKLSYNIVASGVNGNNNSISPWDCWVDEIKQSNIYIFFIIVPSS